MTTTGEPSERDPFSAPDPIARPYRVAVMPSGDVLATLGIKERITFRPGYYVDDRGSVLLRFDRNGDVASVARRPDGEPVLIPSGEQTFVAGSYTTSGFLLRDFDGPGLLAPNARGLALVGVAFR